MDKNKNVWIWVAVVALVVILGFWLMNKDGDDVDTIKSTDTTDVEPTEDVTEGSVNATSPAASISYQQALIKYKDARIQLSPACQATPNNVTFKDGASLMIDNRSNTAKTVKLGSTFSIKAYGFKIVKLSSSTLPATWLMDCGASQNVATVLIQK
jgi:hypothetical protein